MGFDLNFSPNSSTRKVANSVEVLTPNVIKQGDTKNELRVRFLHDTTTVDLSTASVTWSAATTKGTVVADRAATIHPDGEVSIKFEETDLGVNGTLRIEFRVTYADGTVEKFPADDYVRFHVTVSLDDLTQTPVLFASVSYFNEKVTTAEAAAKAAAESAKAADQRALLVEQQGITAEEQGNLAAEKAADAETAAQTALSAAETAQTNQLAPVANFAAIATTYPAPSNGDEVQTLDTGKIYRRRNNAWEYVKELTPGPVSLLSQQLADKADKTYVNTKVQEQVNGVKGTYPLLSDLQAAFPSGATGNYVVANNGDGTVNGYIYTWKENAWTSTGILYQATGIANEGVKFQHLSPDVLAAVEVIEEEDVATSSNQTWTKTVPVLQSKDNHFHKGVPNFERKTVLFIGSSTATGYGATDYNGWVQQLQVVLESKGYTVYNHSIHGDTTAAVINRFYKDVAPVKADYIVMCLTMNNDGLLGASDHNVVYNSFMKNMHRLCEMIRQQGSVPIVCSSLPQSANRAVEYQYIRQFHEELETWNVGVINFFGAVDDGTGKWITEANAGDGYHTNDTGHRELFRAVPPSFFDRIGNWSPSVLKEHGGAIRIGGTAIASPLSYKFSSPIRAFTIFFRVKASSGSAAINKVFAGIGAADALKIENPTGPYQLTFTDSALNQVSTVNGKIDRLWHSIAVTHTTIDNTTRFFVDGAQVGVDVKTPVTFDAFALAGMVADGSRDAQNYDFKDLLIYRTRLLNTEVKELHKGNYLKGCLDLYSPLSDKTFEGASRMVNMAPTDSYLIANTSLLSAVDASVSVADVIAQNVQLVGGGRLYVESGSLKYMKPDGTTTTIVT